MLVLEASLTLSLHLPWPMQIYTSDSPVWAHVPAKASAPVPKPVAPGDLVPSISTLTKGIPKDSGFIQG
jgi:hypothetical protein